MAGDEEVKPDEGPAAAAAGCAAEDSSHLVDSAPPDTEITARLNKGFVAWILNRKCLSFSEDADEHYSQMINDPDRPEEYTQEYLEEERDMMRELVAHNKRSRERFERFQRWVRRQLEERGYVEVGESYLAQCDINRRSMPAEQWRALMGGLMGELKLDEDGEEEEDRLVEPGADGGITIEYH